MVLQSFIAVLAGIYCASSITNYVSAIKAWHLIHGVAWDVNHLEIQSVIKGAKVMAPPPSTRAKREPMPVNYMVKLRPHFSDQTPLDVAVYACLTSAFWSTARLGELTVKNLQAFDPASHVKRSDLGERVDRNGFKTTVIHVPKTKSNPTTGEDLYWAKQAGDSDPESALRRHLELNNPDADFHLFGYTNKKKKVPLTKKTFLKRVSDAALEAGMKPFPGHSIRIGSTLEYLLRGLPFDVVKVKGRWSSDAFHQYIRDHAMVLAPYMQSAPPSVNDQFIGIAISPPR